MTTHVSENRKLKLYNKLIIHLIKIFEKILLII
jgi:hypothetical protein